MSQPLNQREIHPPLGELDRAHGEFWMRNPWENLNENLSAYERNRILWNIGGSHFIDISHQTSADTDSDSRAVAVGDFNQDGLPDLIVQNVGGGPLHVYENQWPQRNWLRLSLRGVRSNRLGLGAKIKLVANGHVQWRELYPLISYRSQLPVYQLFGLANSESVDSVTIYWPSGEVQNIQQLPVNRHIRITEGDANWSEVIRGPRLSTVLPILPQP